MARIWIWLIFAGCLGAWAQEPPEEDAGSKKTEYAFNPLKAAQEIKVGDFYWKRASWRSAAGRYKEATLWNPGSAEAFLKLGDCYDKLKDADSAREAYAKFVELEPGHRRAAEIKKKLMKPAVR